MRALVGAVAGGVLFGAAIWVAAYYSPWVAAGMFVGYALGLLAAGLDMEPPR